MTGHALARRALENTTDVTARALDTTVRAFQRRWRPKVIDGEIDGQIGGLLFELLLERDLGRAT